MTNEGAPMAPKKKRMSMRKSADRKRNPNVIKLRRQVVEYLGSSHAHVDFDATIRNFPPDRRGIRPPGAPHTAWQLLEHIRIAQWDILEFSRNPKHLSPNWPSGYWPASDAPPNAKAWDQSVRAFRADRKAMQRLLRNPKTDITARIPHGTGQTTLREALLVMDHNAYHLGQLVMLSKMLNTWKE
jgi:uncharacterized damage-inducible protein DinB